ncbi:MAG: nucleoside recognition domain-containing protein [Pseudoflavonifractor sp.]|nr:nucleoside recognition domain-containing protein [Alloprevotella sp.]MCM1117370.1 nucleoside recognition domain-containing protein [Pseudoflavonifractor sp.]
MELEKSPAAAIDAKPRRRSITSIIPSGIICLAVVFGLFYGIGVKMGVANMLNTIMHTAHDLLLNTVFYLMGICVVTGALGRLFVEFGVVSLIEKMLRPLMGPLFRLPGVAALGAVMTFLSDNPAIISLAQDKRFGSYFKKFQYISLTNFGTAFGMGLLVMVFMVGQGYFLAPLIGLIGAFFGCVVSTRIMQHFVIKQYPAYLQENAVIAAKTADNPLGNTPQDAEVAEKEAPAEKSLFIRILNSLLDGGRTGVDVGIAIIPGVLIISTLVMILTFGPSASGDYTGAAYEGVEVLPWLAGKINFIFEWLFGFHDPHLVAFPITALGAVGAALSLVPNFIAQGWADGNAIAVFTAIGMCWSGYLSTHTAMLDSLGYRDLTPKAILAHTIGGIFAALVAHGLYVLVTLFL